MRDGGVYARLRAAGLLGAAALLAACGRSPTDVVPEVACERVSQAVLELPPPPAHLVARRAAVAASIGDGVLVVKAGEPDPNPTDNGYRGDPSLFYLAGLDVPGAWLVLHIRGGAVDSTVLYLPAAATSATAPVEVRGVTAAHAVRCAARLSPDVRRLAVAEGRTLFLPWRNPAIADTLLAALRAQGHVPQTTTRLDALRLVKDSAEIARLRRAAEITAQSIAGAAGSIRAGNDEGDVASAIERLFRERGATAASFPSIVAAGPSALILHYNANDRALAGDELILMDVGAEYGRYAGDVTRTYPVAGRFSERQRALYELVLGAQEAAIAAVRPGVTRAALEQVARTYLRDHSNGLCGANPCDAYFIHSLTHWLGLNVHDVGGNVLLEPGIVLTIEPGIYLPDEGIGIRIEDDVLVTPTGYEILSVGAAKGVVEIEELLGEG